MKSFRGASNIQKQYARRILLDCMMIPSAFYLALLVQNYGDCSFDLVILLSTYIVPLTIVHIAINAMSGIYSQLWAYADLRAAWNIFRASAISTLLLWGGNAIFGLFPGLDNGVIIVAGLFNALLSTGFKYRRLLLPPSIREFLKPMLFTVEDANIEQAIIIGTNSNARQISMQLSRHDGQTRIKILGYIDDDPQKIGMAINGLKVIGVTAQIPELVRTHAVDILIIAVGDMDQEGVWQLISICQETPAQIKVLPGIANLMDQQYHHPLALRELQIEDLLQRQPLQVDTEPCRNLLQDKVILVTGAAGSIGSELCRQLCHHDPALLLLLDNNETGLFDLNLGLKLGLDRISNKIRVQLLLADITDRVKMEKVFKEYRPHIVFHAAAYKHVPLVEMNPDQALQVNIKGTMVISETAHKYHVRNFVFISTDKAVNPQSVMGASKYAGEVWLRALDAQSQTVFTIVRFGNVIGSRGSVLPIFANQIARGGPVTVTHKEMKRFFISIPEAISLVMQAATFGKGGDIFMLHMGDEVRIQDLAERMIRLQGLRVHKDIPIQYIGVRPGEKLSEELYYEDEKLLTTPHPRVFQLRTNSSLPSIDEFRTTINTLERYSKQPGSDNRMRQLMIQLAERTFGQSPAAHAQTAVAHKQWSETADSAFV